MNRVALGILAGVALAGAGAFALAQGTGDSGAPITASPATPSETNAAPDTSAPAAPGATAPAPATAAPPASSSAPSTAPKPAQVTAAPAVTPGAANATAATGAPPQPPIPLGPSPTPPNAVLVMTGLDKITGRPTRVIAHLNQPVQFATLVITARYCYSTPASETPETTAFLQIDDHRPDQPWRRVFSGWMYASTPGLNALEHPLYDVWVISCNAKVPGQARPTVATAGAVKVLSPDSTDKEALPTLPEGSGQ